MPPFATPVNLLLANNHTNNTTSTKLAKQIAIIMPLFGFTFFCFSFVMN